MESMSANGSDLAKCPFPHGDRSDAVSSETCPVAGTAQPHWTADAQAIVRERAAGWSHGDAARGEELARGVAEERARARREEITSLFLRTLGKKLGYGHPLSEKGEELRFTWTPEAEARLAEVPDFCRELTRWRVEWTAQQARAGHHHHTQRDGGEVRAVGTGLPRDSGP